MPTDENAQNAYAGGESQANRKYSVFAEKAAAEGGYPAVAKLFRAASEAEAVHAKRLLFILNAVGSTEENLKSAMEGENYEFMEMYPPRSSPRRRRSAKTRHRSSSPMR